MHKNKLPIDIETQKSTISPLTGLYISKLRRCDTDLISIERLTDFICIT